MSTKHRFEPDYVVAPGATLKETIEANGLTQSQLAQRTGLAEKTISQIINGVAPITYDTAAKLELATGVSAKFWNRRELSYREVLTRREEMEHLAADIPWLSEIPVKELIHRGFIDASEDKATLVHRALRFFGVSNVSAWGETWINPFAQYRGKKTQEKHPGYVAAWLRIGVIQASSVDCEAFDAQEFKRGLRAIRENVILDPAGEWAEKLRSICASAGVIVVLTKEIPTTGVSGATRWITKDRALIQLSLKYKTDDQFWFTFFHEAGHVLLHGKKQIFLEFGMPSDADEDECEANKFARESLILPSDARRLPYLKSLASVRQFAAEINLRPGIVVGRLQKENLWRLSHGNGLKTKIQWTDG